MRRMKWITKMVMEMAPAVDPPSGRVPEQDQSDPLMHVKCIHELCMLLLDIPTYLQLI